MTARSALLLTLLLCSSCKHELPAPAPHADGCPKPSEAAYVVQISAAFNGTMALMSDGTARCWGNSDYGECAIGRFAASNVPMVSQGINCATEIAIDGSVAAARRADGSVLVWSDGTYGELAPTGRSDIPTGVPTLIPGLPPVIRVAAGNGAVFVITEAGELLWWGTSDVVDGGPTSRLPVPYSGLSDIVDIQHEGSTCALDKSGSVWCFGFNRYGQLGDGTTADRTDPRVVSGISPASMIGVGSVHTCALLMDGSVSCWGANQWGNLGRGTTDGMLDPVGMIPFWPTPSQVLQLPPSKLLSVGDQTSCVITLDDEVYCWGFDTSASFGSVQSGAFPTPVHLSVFDGATQLAVSATHICGLMVDHRVICQGEVETLGAGDGGPTPAAEVRFDQTVDPWE